MAPTDDRSTTKMPPLLIAAAVALFALRAGAGVLPVQAPAQETGVAWHEYSAGSTAGNTGSSERNRSAGTGDLAADAGDGDAPADAGDALADAGDAPVDADDTQPYAGDEAAPSPASASGMDPLWHELGAGGREGALTLYEFRADWSAPSKHMEAHVLQSRQIAALIAKSFVPVRVTDLQKELGRNPRRIAALEKRFRIFAFPTLVVTDADGEVVGTLVGNASALSTFQFLTRALHAGRQS